MRKPASGERARGTRGKRAEGGGEIQALLRVLDEHPDETVLQRALSHAHTLTGKFSD